MFIGKGKITKTKNSKVFNIGKMILGMVKLKGCLMVIALIRVRYLFSYHFESTINYRQGGLTCLFPKTEEKCPGFTLQKSAQFVCFYVFFSFFSFFNVDHTNNNYLLLYMIIFIYIYIST